MSDYFLGMEVASEEEYNEFESCDKEYKSDYSFVERKILEEYLGTRSIGTFNHHKYDSWDYVEEEEGRRLKVNCIISENKLDVMLEGVEEHYNRQGELIKEDWKAVILEGEILEFFKWFDFEEKFGQKVPFEELKEL